MSAGKILVIDDDPRIRRVMRSSLTAHGYQVNDARSGEEGLQQLRDSNYDLVLLDMNMLGMGGMEACRLIRSSSEIAIIMLTVNNTERQKVAAALPRSSSCVSRSTTSRPGSPKANGLSKTPLTTLKTDVTAPIPSASVRMATVVKPGDLRSWQSRNGGSAACVRATI